MNARLQVIKDDVINKLTVKEKEFKFDFTLENSSEFKHMAESALKTAVRAHRIELTAQEQEDVISEVISYFIGSGPIEGLLKDKEVTEIMINGPGQIYVERKGNLELTDITFESEAQISYFIEKIISPMGRRVSEFEPFVDARLNDGSRVNIVRSPVSRIGPVLTIRKFSYNVLRLEELINLGSVDSVTAQFLKACVISKINILISGGAGSGKTTFLNALIDFIPENERLITIEDTMELVIARKHTVPMETRPFNIEGKGEVTMRDLFKNALHMRPDRIIAGEVRGEEVLEMIQAMNTGHAGSMTTLHANSPLEALDRLEILALMGNSNMSSEVARRQIIGAVDLVVCISRFPDGSRKVTQISEVIKTKEYSMQDIFVYDEASKALKPTNIKPHFLDKLRKLANYSMGGA
jgi:pilus assembly protein CpaF